MKAMTKSALAKAAGVSTRTLMRWLKEPYMQQQLAHFPLSPRQQKRYGVHAVLMETNHIFGDKQLAEVYIPIEEIPLDLIYRVNIPRSGIWLQGKKTQWLWPNRETRRTVEVYLQTIEKSREEIRLEVTEM